jgi:hypothetical protein
LDVSLWVEIGHLKVIVEDIVVGLKRQSNSFFSIVKGEGEVELGMRMYSTSRRVNLNVVNDRDVTKGASLQRMCYSKNQKNTDISEWELVEQRSRRL